MSSNVSINIPFRERLAVGSITGVNALTSSPALKRARAIRL
jgi:hypothetical protein